MTEAPAVLTLLPIFVRESLQEGVLEGETLLDLEFIKEYLPCRCRLILFHIERAILDIKVLVLQRQEVRYHTQVCVVMQLFLVDHRVVGHSTFVIFLKRVAVEETSAWVVVSMHVAEDGDLPFFVDHPCKALCSIEYGLQVWRWLIPLTIQVEAGEVGALVAMDDAIDVEHWHNVEDDLFSQLLRIRIR